jgi:trehalose-6-phosphatase
MKNLFGDWSRIQTLIKQRPLLICLDYDGTLSPIAPTPRRRLANQNKTGSPILVASHGISVAVISGRLCLTSRHGRP